MNSTSMKLCFGAASIANGLLYRSRREALSPTPVQKAAPVLVMPGFLGNDSTTAPLRSALRSAGHDALPWRVGLNLGPRDRLIDRLTERVSNIVEANRRDVILVGHSLGGLYAREVARISPQLVRMVITLGSPVRALERGIASANLDIVRMMIERASGRTIADLQTCRPADLQTCRTKDSSAIWQRRCQCQASRSTARAIASPHGKRVCKRQRDLPKTSKLTQRTIA